MAEGAPPKRDWKYVGKRVAVGVGLLAVVLLAELFLDRLIVDEARRQIALFATVNVAIALSLNVINGMAGQFSIGHAGFVGIGAYTGALVTSWIHPKLGGADPTLQTSFVVMPLALLAAGLVAGAFGFLVGLPSLRLKGDYLAIVTLGFAEIFRLLIATSSPEHVQLGGVRGFIASLGGQNGYAGGDGTGLVQYAGPFWLFGTAIVFAIASWRIKFSGWGRALRALREDEVAAASVGVDPTRYKVISFVLAAAGGGMAGALLSNMRGGSYTVTPDQFTFVQSFDYITMVILGGSGSVSGTIVGALVVSVTIKAIEEVQSLGAVQALKVDYPSLDLNALRMVVYAALLIGLMILRPEGIFGEREIVKEKPKTGPPPPPSMKGESPVSDGAAEESA